MDSEIRGKWRNLIHVETQTTQLDNDEVRREVRYYISQPARSKATTGSIGASRASAIGFWTPHSAKTTTKPRSDMQPKTSEPCGGSY